MNALKTFFLSRAAREKALLVAFAALVFLSLGADVIGRSRTRRASWQSVQAEAAAQQVWLDHAETIATRATAATQRLDPAKTLSATGLVAELNQLAVQAGLTADIGSQHTERTSQFSFHAVQVNFRRADLAPILNFYSALAARSPYLALEEFSLAADRANPGKLNVGLRVMSVELAH